MTLLAFLGLLSIALTIGFTCYAYFSIDAGDGQSRRASLVEAWTNVVIGFSFNYVANIFLLPLVHAQLTAASNFWLGCIYTAISVLRSYTLRRFFNVRSFAERLAKALA